MSHTLLAGLGGADWRGMLIALAQVVLIDLVLAGDNAVAVGMAAFDLQPKLRRQVILAGLGAAVALRIAFALAAQGLLSLIGLKLAGGLILLFVGWKMWRDLRADARARRQVQIRPARTFRQAFVQIFLADLAMSLDNVLAVAGAALRHPLVLIFGLILSIGLMGVAANAIAAVLHRARWISYLGLLLVVYVALHMIWEGYRGDVVDLGQTKAYNDLMPGTWLDIKPDEAARHAHRDR